MKKHNIQKLIKTIPINLYALFFPKRAHWRECVKDFIFNPTENNILKWASYGPTKVICTKVNKSGIYIIIRCIHPSIFIGYHGKNIRDFQAVLSRQYNTKFKITVTEDDTLIRTKWDLVKTKFIPNNKKI